MAGAAQFIATARTDGRDWLVEAAEPLSELQLRSGGDLPGIIATPALLQLVRKSRKYGLRLARAIQAQDDSESVTAWVEIEPDEDGEGCRIGLTNWQAAPLTAEDQAAAARRHEAIERHVAELAARLGPQQEVLSVDCDCAELAEIAQRLREGQGRRWTELVEIAGDTRRKNLHWRLLDGARLVIPGSSRHWKAVLLPLGRAEPGKTGFDLLFVADEPPAPAPRTTATKSVFSTAIGRDIAPVLRQPISRIIANAETIRTQLAGPLSDEYSKYAADIATAGEHLLALIDDLADLEVVEAEEFDTAPDKIDLADVARRASGILGVRSRERGISIDAPKDDESVLAVGEFRRVLQILLNLLGNALRYAPEGSQVWLRAEREGGRARLTVADQGEGLSAEQQARVFEKFERLGRSGDGGSGLGLYISRRLARAMDGELSVESAPGQGARFTLELPAFDDRRQKRR
ncbi:sensor histidine kinase [Croceibacterium aestuarii]|uniref:sensor histidine kinase n=1 Tax=Croceibacterium aestuarii TaxID=3064139 RepID=UPI00272E38D7|nr:HAMP domain-containing sensor histidine kinase [Croceibacterium sp. D39]